ncbi:MAG: Gfo/Idh/MocA family oxidoreductase [Chloroflexi bacterium]|nr:Gfo/Idh/MocA family oxidoreductase [Chloroflexota bacterium]
MKQLRAALIGCGKMGSEYSSDIQQSGVYSHAHAYSAHPATELVAVCDADLRRAKACANQWSVPAHFDDYREMLAVAKPDIVSICTPDETHFAVGMNVLETEGVRGVICEKPLALDVSQAQAMAQSASAHEVALLVNYSRRFDAAYQTLRCQIQKGRLGSIQAVSGYYGKGLLHNGSHWLDLLRFLFGEVRWVIGKPTGWAFGDDLTCDVWLGMESGFTAFLHGTDSEAYTVFEMDILGSSGRVRISRTGRNLEYYEAQDSPVVAGYRELSNEPYLTVNAMSEAILGAVDNMVLHLEESAMLACSGSDAVETLALVEAVRASALTGECVPVKALR